jgi:amino acid adenylation domain-containing protein
MEELFTKVIDILYLAKQNDVEVILNGDRLQLKVPENKTIDEQLINEIRVNKQAIIDFLTHHNLNNSGNTAQYDKITTFDRDTVSLIPVSFSQERIWFIDQLEGSLQYHLPAVLLLEGDLDIDALERTFATIVNRHEVLRTVIRETDGQSYQHIKAADGWKLTTALNGSYTDGTSRLKDHISALIEQPFDLSADDMLRAHVIKLDNGAHILVITMHHIAADAWSMPVLVNEISTLYKAFANKETPVLQPLPLQFADYALWQRNTLGEEQLHQKLHYWETKLQDVAPLQLPADNVRPVNGSTRGVTIDFNIDNDITKAVQQLGRVNGATLYMTLLAAFKVLLYRYTGQEDICVGTSIAGRPQRELEGLIGFFVNTLALRDEVKGEHTFTELLAQVKQTTLEAYAHQDVPFERVVEATVKERQVGVSPLFQVMLVLGNTPQVPELKLGDLKLTGYEYEHKTVKFDLTIFVTETAQGLKCAIQYSTDLYNTPRIEQLITHFKTILSAIAASPDVAISKLQLITSAEEQWLLQQAHSECNYPVNETLVSLFAAKALNNPTVQAVVFEGRSLTYQELNVHANQLAHHLQRRGVKAGTLVPLFIERGIEMIVAILGILKAGGAYVPVDTDFPADRVKYMLEDTGAALVISSSRYADKLPDTAQNLKVLELDELDFELSLESENDPEILPLPEHLAYMIYTSGSTGRPKGVLIDHANITDYIFGLNERTAISGCRTFGLLSTIATDLGNTVLFSSLAYGRTLHIFAKETVSNIHALHSYFDEHRIDCIKIVPSHWKALSPENDAPLLPAKLIVFGGEALSSGSVNHIRRYSDCRIINHYGPTETTVGKLLYEVTDEPSGNNIIPIGRPFSNTVVYVLSKQLQLCPVGVPGELYIGGIGISRGYHQQEKLTEEKFIQNPFGPEGALMYQTGDRVVMNADGNIEYIGRVDDQVKIRGYRVEPGEVSRVIQESDYVNQAVVIVRDDKQGNKQLAAYIVPSAQFDADLLHDYLKEQLPEYMIPSYITELEIIPLTANGKIDRKALPDPENTLSVSGYIAPRNEEEQQMADIWQRILDMDKVGVTDDFFRLGGHSLLAVRLIAEVRKAFKLELPISEIFDHPTVELLTIRLAQQQVSVLPPITVQQRPKLIPLSYSQERLWFIDRMEGSLQYHVPAILNLIGPVNVAALNATFSTIVDRHEVLRTVIREQEGQGYQLIKPANNWALKQTSANDLNGYSVEEYIKEQVAQPFDLSADDMLRVELVKITDDAHTLILTMHHIASDGSSGAILVKELIEIYNALITKREPVLVTLPVQYADYAIWQRAYLQGELLATRLDYWKEKLTGVATLQLPADHMRPSVQTTNGALHEFTIGSQLSQKVQEFSHENNVTLYMTLLAAFKVLLYRYSGQEDICVGTPVANRNQHEVDGLIGFFVNTLALRSGVNSDMTFANLLSKVKQTTLQAYEYQDVPFEKVVEAVVRERDQSRSPLFQVMFVLQNTPTIPVLQLGEMTLQQNAAGHDTAKFDITLFVIESANGLRCGLEYNTDIYDTATMGRMASHYEKLLNAAVNNPAELLGQLDMIDDAEQQLLTAFNNTAVDYPKNETIIDLFEAQAVYTPNATAVVIDGEQIIYADLNKRANQLARYLQKQGITSGALVPLCIERSIDMIIGILAVLKAGGAYVPVDPQFPQERIDYMLADSGASIVLTSIQSSVHVANSEVVVIEINGRDKQAIAAENNTDLHTGINAEQLTYVLYTSGSTGKPKGVMMPEGNLYNLLKWQDSQFENKSRKVLQFAAYTFDVSFQEIFSTICFGSTLYLIDGDKRKDVNELVAHINKYGITHLFFPFVVLQNLAEYVAAGSGNMPSVEEIIIAGEQLKITDEIRTLTRKTGAVIINQYGPTEAHVVSSYIVDGDSSGVLPPIGIPVSNTQIHIESEKGVLSPVGIYGEICIGGVQVARGYLNQPELTAEKFITDPYIGTTNARMYKTGDIGRWLADGNIEYLGRKDDQVKIRGYRVELGEIESVLLQSGLVQQAVVLARADDQGIKRLIAYVTTDDEYDRDELQSYLKSRLPEYMVPRLWVQLESFPLTPNGKIDKRALPEAELSAQITETYVAPRNEIEEKLAAIWQQLLGIGKAGIHDNFFELGGHSLLGMRVISHFRREHGGELTIRDLFAYPTIAELAEQVQKATIAIPAITAEERPQYIPLSYSQERLWFIDQLEGSAPYHLPAALRLSGKPDVQALEASFRHIVDRHEVLRTVIREHEGQSYQMILPAGNWQLKETAIQGDLNSYISEAVKKPFDLSEDLMLRAELINAGEEGYILLLVMHHIASDGWSTPILVKEFMTLYAGYADHKEVILPQLAVQYADYAIWQRNYLQGSVLETRLNYWKEKLSGVSTLQLATDHIRPAVQSSNGAVYLFTIGKEETSKLQTLGKQEGATLYMTLLSIFKVLLYRYSGQQDICVGSPVANRDQAEVSDLIGFFVNTLALRSNVAGDDTFSNLLQQVKQTTLEAYEHQDVPFEKVVEVVVKDRDQSRSPLFQVLFVLQNTPALPALQLGDISITAADLTEHTAKYDISFNLLETENGLRCIVEYNTDLYEEETIAGMAAHYTQLVQSLLLEPGAVINTLTILDEAEEILLQSFNNTAAKYPAEQNIISLFEAQAAEIPDAMALIFEQESLSYKELNEHSNQLAHYLQKAGVSKESLVPVCMERGIAMMVSILAILKAGGAYVPVDMEYPQERIAYILADTKAGVVLCTQKDKTKLNEIANGLINVIEIDGTEAELIATENIANLNIDILPDQLAYIIYTSGSTGNPKGVMVEHGNVISLVKNAGYVVTGPDDTLLVTGSPAFDATTFEYWSMLLNGGRLILSGDGELLKSNSLKNTDR